MDLVQLVELLWGTEYCNCVAVLSSDEVNQVAVRTAEEGPFSQGKGENYVVKILAL
jgi:hypothetical protein